MRTTLDIDDEVLSAAKELGRQQRLSVGQVISDLARQGLRAAAVPSSSLEAPASFYGFRPIAPGGTPVSNDSVNKLRDESGM